MARRRNTKPTEPATERWEEARRRVGIDDVSRLKWLFEFTRHDLSIATRERLAEIEAEIHVFEQGSRTRALNVEGDQVSVGRFDKNFGHVRNLQQQWQQLMQQLLIAGKTQYATRATFELYRDVKGGRVEQGLSTTTEATFVLSAFDVFAIVGDRLRTCRDPKCRVLFVAATGKKEFCSVRCAQRVRTQQWRQEHPETVREIRRDAYVRRQKKKYGAKVKVARRSRGPVPRSKRG
jgi:hypothetical protein